MSKPPVYIERAEVYNTDLAEGLGKLLTHLSSSFHGEPVPEDVLRPIIEGSDSEQILAYSEAGLVGSSVLSIRRGNKPPGVKLWLEDFVVDPDYRGEGVANLLADEWESWGREKGAREIGFTSSWGKVAAHRFYLRRGAVILNSPPDQTAVFRYPIPE